MSGAVEHCSYLVVCGCVLCRALTSQALNVEVSSARHRCTTQCGGAVIQSVSDPLCGSYLYLCAVLVTMSHIVLRQRIALQISFVPYRRMRERGETRSPLQYGRRQRVFETHMRGNRTDRLQHSGASHAAVIRRRIA